VAGCRQIQFLLQLGGEIKVDYLWQNFFRRDQHEQEIDQLLKENYIFKVLTPTELKFVKSLVHFRQYQPGEAIFKQGEFGVAMYIVVKGHINVTIEESVDEHSSRTVFITRLQRGDFFGELALVEQGGKRTATAVAADEVHLLEFLKSDLSEVVERNPRTAVKILSRLSEVLGRRLKETADRFTEMKRELKAMSDHQHGSN
jgi:CRP/FNR family transcriptional regulator, cyclic AMP receptor protein